MVSPQIWNGSSWVALTDSQCQYWNGSAWVAPSDISYWNGSAWQSLFPNTITLRATASNQADAVNSLGVTIPATVQVGDLLVLLVAQTINGATVFNAISGWTKQGEQRAGAAAHTLAVFTKIAGPGDAGSTVTSTSASTENYAAHIRAYAGVNQTTPLDAPVAFAQVDPAATSGSAPAVTVATTGAMLVGVYTVPTTANTTLNASNWTDPTGFSNEVANCTTSINNNAALASYDKISSSTGSQGPFAATITQSRRWALATIAIKPA